MNYLDVFNKCMNKTYNDPNLGNLVNSLYKIVNKYPFNNDIDKVKLIEGVYPLLVRIHKEYNIDNIDDLLEFLFNHDDFDFYNNMTNCKVKESLNVVFFPKEAEDYEYDIIMGYMRDKRLIDVFKNIDYQREYKFIELLKIYNYYLREYEKMKTKEFEGREYEYSLYDATEAVFSRNLISQIASFIYQNDYGLNTLHDLYKYMLVHIDELFEYHELNKTNIRELNFKLRKSIIEKIYDNYNKGSSTKEKIIK